MVNGNVKIGHGSVIGANSFINNEDIPPFSMVVGNPSRIIKRYDMKLEKWVTAKDFIENDENRLPTEEDYLLSLRNKFPELPIFFHATGQIYGDLP